MERLKRLYGVSTWLYEEKDLYEALNKISNSGFKCVEIWANKVHLDPRIDPDIQAIKNLIIKLGIWVHSIHAPFTGLNIGYPDINMEKNWLKIIGKSLEYADELEAGIVVLHTVSHKEELDNQMYKKSLEITKEFLKKLSIYAKQLGIKLALENQPATNTVPFANSLIELRKIWVRDEIGFCLDIGHASINGCDINLEISSAGKRLISVHVNNNDGNTDRHWVPSKGVIDWQNIKKQLENIGYYGPYILEIRGGNDPDKILDQLKEYAKQGQHD